MIERLGKIKLGENILTQINGKHSNMLMDISIDKLQKGESKTYLYNDKEMAVLLIDGDLTLKWEDKEASANRTSVFDEAPTCLHVCKNVEVEVFANSEVEILVQLTVNEGEFESKLYNKEKVRTDIFGEGVWNDTARRAVRTIFDYANAPYSNMVMGEVITYPGKWSSYIPHHHEQPEVYYYKFDKPQGFGFSLIGDDAYKIVDNSFAVIPGGLVHPQTSAPGYAMYYCWMIRHFDNNPWTDRINLDEHKWLLEKGYKNMAKSITVK